MKEVTINGVVYNTGVGIPYTVPLKMFADGSAGVSLLGLGGVQVVVGSDVLSNYAGAGIDQFGYVLATAAVDFRWSNADGAAFPSLINGATPSIDTDVSVTTASTTLAAANSTRRSLTLQNNGTDTVWLAWGGAAVVSAGRSLPPGASVSWSGESCPSSALTGIVATTAGNVNVLET